MNHIPILKTTKKMLQKISPKNSAKAVFSDMKTDPKVSFTETHLDTVTNPYLSNPPTDPHRGHQPSLLQRRHQAMIPPIALGWFFQGQKTPPNIANFRRPDGNQ